MRLFWQRMPPKASALLALVVRCYLAYIWLRFGVGKIQSGWLTSNLLRPLVELVANGYTHAWLPAYALLSRLVLDLGLDHLLAVAFPLTELAIAAALVTGVLLRPVMLLAILINLNLVLCGLAAWQVDGRIIVMELLVLAFGTAASRYGWRSVKPLIGLPHHRGETTMSRAPRRLVA